MSPMCAVSCGMGGRRRVVGKPTGLLVLVALLLLLSEADAFSTATQALDGQYSRVSGGVDRYCNSGGECYTRERLPSGVVRYCRENGGGCRYLSA